MLNIYSFIQSFFAIWAVSRLCGLSTRNPIVLVLFVIFTFFFRYISVQKKAVQGASYRRTRLISCLTALFFTLASLFARHEQLTAGLDNTIFCFIILCASAVGFFFFFNNFLLFVCLHDISFSLTEMSTVHTYRNPSLRSMADRLPAYSLPVISFFFCLLCWLPYFLYEYPAIMTPDSINQLEQVLGMIPYSNHHPWAHTMVIKFWYSVGSLFTQSPNAALAFFTVFQMCFMALCVSWLAATLRKLRIGVLPCLLTAAFYAFVPYHGVFAVTIWKDVMFSGSVLLLTTALVRLLCLSVQSKKETIFSLVIYILSGIMMCLFRSNGWYAFLFSLPFLLFAFRHRLKIMLPVHILILTVVLIIKLPVMNAFHVTQPDFVESICIPLQQVARVICEDKELSEEQWDSIHKIIDTTYIKELYAPDFADNMKELVRAGNPEYLTEHKEEYLKLWLSLGLKYPSTYLQAHIDQTIGYWYPDVAYTVGDIDGIINNETGVYSQPLIGGPFVVKTKEILIKLGDILPLYGLLSSIGAMFWTLICCIGITAVKKQYCRLVIYLPGLAVILTLFIATPVASEFRYAYSLACTLPLYLLLPFTGSTDES